MTVTAADRARAERLRAVINEPGGTVKELAAILAEIREEAVSCAVVRVEREFNVKERKRAPENESDGVKEGSR
jgi:hypothetical protein